MLQGILQIVSVLISLFILLWYDGVLVFRAVAVLDQVVAKLFRRLKLCAFYNTALVANVVSVVNLRGHTPTIIQSVVIDYLLHCSVSLVILCAIVFRSSCSSAIVALSSLISFCIYCTANSILQSPIVLKNLQVQNWL